MSFGGGGLSSKNAPELDLPGRFMILAMVLLAFIAVLSPFAYPLLIGTFYDPHLLAFVHLNTLGVIAAVLVGASYQLVPVVLQTPLSSVRFGRVSFWLYIVGIVLFLPGLYETYRPALAIGAALVFSALVVYLLIVATTLRQAPISDVVSWHIAVALVGLAAGIVMGLVLALNKGAGFLGTATFRILATHATLMLGAWVIIMLNGVAYRLVGMFTLSEEQLWHRVAWAELAFSAIGAWVLAGGLFFEAPRTLLGLAAMTILVGQILFAVQLAHMFHVRRRRGFDIHIPYAMTAGIMGIIAAALLTGGLLFTDETLNSNLWIAICWLVIAGIVLTAIQGFFYKITTFLVWLRSYAPLAGRGRVPRLEELYDRRTAQIGWVLWVVALVASVTAIFLSNRPLSIAAGIVALTGLGCFLVNVGRIGSHVVRPVPAASTPRPAPGRIPGVGKEGKFS